MEEGGEARRLISGDLGRDIGGRAAGADFVPEDIAVIALFGIDHVAVRRPFAKSLASLAAGDASAGDRERDSTTSCVRQRVNFSGSAATRADDRLAYFPLFPHLPIAERLARPIIRKRIEPQATCFQDMNEPADPAPLVDALLASHPGGQQRSKLGELSLG